MSDMTPARLAELDTLYAATTPGTRHLMAGMPTNVLTDGGLRVARCDFDGTVNAEAECNARGIVALHNSYPALAAAARMGLELASRVKELEVEIAHQKHIVDRHVEVRKMLADDIVALGTGKLAKLELSRGAENRIAALIAEMGVVQLDLKIRTSERDRLAERLAEAEELLRQAMLRRTCYCESASCHCGAYRHSADFGKAAAAFLASTEPAK